MYSHLNVTKSLATSDEVFYHRYARIIGANGIAGFKEIVDWYSQDEKNRWNPAPTRLGFLLPVAVMVVVFPKSIFPVACFSFVSHLIFLGLSFLYTRKFFGENTAYAALLLMSGSPLMMVMAASGLTESLSNLLWGLSIWLFLDFTRERTNKAYGLLLAALSWAMLVREMTVVLVAYFVFAALIYNRFYKGQITFSRIVMICVVPLAFWVLVYSGMLGMDGAYFDKLVHALFATHFQDQSNPYALNNSSGPWFRYLVDFMLLAPAVTVFAVGYVFQLLQERKVMSWERSYLFYYLVFSLVVFNIPQHSKVVRFVINLEMVLCLFAVFTVWKLFDEDIRRQKFLKPLITVLLLFVLSISGFYHIFVAKGGRMVDPVTRDLMISQGFMEPVPGSPFYKANN